MRQVILAVQVLSPASLVITTSYEHIVFPNEIAVATPVTIPETADL